MNRVLETLGKLEQQTDFNSCFPILEAAKLSDDELRAVVDAKFCGDRKQMGEAYKQYGARLVSPQLRATTEALIRSGSRACIETYSPPVI